MHASHVKHLIVHCSDSQWGDANEIRRWHTDPKPKGNGWNDIGYHYVICNQYPTYLSQKQGKPVAKSDGAVQKGRENNVAGAHAVGFNSNSLGICLIGVKDFSERQMQALVKLCKELMAQYKIPVQNVLGHCETPKAGGKTCPNLDMKALRARLA